MLPGDTISRLLPSALIWLLTEDLVPSPRPTDSTTVAIPIRMPSTVSPGAQPVRTHSLQTGPDRLCPVHDAAPASSRRMSPSSTRTVRCARCGDLGLVRDQYDGPARAAQSSSSSASTSAVAVRVQVPGRLVGKDHRRLRHQRPRHRDALLLAAGQLARSVMPDTVGEPDAGSSDSSGPLAPLVPADAGVDQRQLDVAQRRSVPASRLNCWNTKPMRRLRTSASSSSVHVADVVTGEQVRPRTIATSRQPRMCMSVDLPEPDGPVIATYSPRVDVQRHPAQRRNLDQAPLR